MIRSIPSPCREILWLRFPLISICLLTGLGIPTPASGLLETFDSNLTSTGYWTISPGSQWIELNNGRAEFRQPILGYTSTVLVYDPFLKKRDFDIRVDLSNRTPATLEDPGNYLALVLELHVAARLPFRFHLYQGGTAEWKMGQFGSDLFQVDGPEATFALHYEDSLELLTICASAEGREVYRTTLGLGETEGESGYYGYPLEEYKGYSVLLRCVAAGEVFPFEMGNLAADNFLIAQLPAGWTDTADWLGLLCRDPGPWAWSVPLHQWLYMEDPVLEAREGWIYVPAGGIAAP